MCGIAGFVYADQGRPASASAIQKMTLLLTHRGPDGGGQYVRRNVALGHRRLSIIDVAAGAQPMVSADGDLAITFNGEIYNYVELREELQSLGHRFTTVSDTEVLLRAYAEWGGDLHRRLNGMWAFGLWDVNTDSLLVSRDRIGEKPLYYAQCDGVFVFASEIKALLAFGVPDTPDFSVLELFLTLGYLPSTLTFYKSIRKLEPGCFAVLRNGHMDLRRYWDLPPIDQNAMNRSAVKASEEFERLLRDSVRLRMRSDVTFGAFLSGGLDSGTIVALMSQLSDRPIQTFTVGFQDESIDERPLARAVAERFASAHHEEVLEYPQLDDMLSYVLRHTDEPFGDSSAVPTGIVAEAASGYVKMVLSGDGGDEVLSGYNAYQTEKLARYMGHLPSSAVRGFARILEGATAVAGPARRREAARFSRLLRLSHETFQNRLMARAAWAPIAVTRSLLAGIDVPQIRLEEFFADLFDRCPWSDPFYQLMYFHLKVSLPEDMLIKVDRMSMAHSLEVRTPFLDHRLIEFMVCVHQDVKMPMFARKAVLRKMLRNTLPPSVMRARKRGFVAPVRRWFANPGIIADVRNRLLGSNMPWSPAAIDALLAEHASLKVDHGNFIWMAMLLSKWFATAPASVGEAA